MAKLVNKRFPHHCRVYNLVDADEWSEGEEILVYDGECRLYNNDSIRNFDRKTNRGRISYGDYAVNIPDTESAFRCGLFIDVDDGVSVRRRIPILDVYRGNLGSTLYISFVKG